MTPLRSALFLAAAATLWSCGTPPGPGTTPPPSGTTLDVTIAAVTLADDCGTGPTGSPVQGDSAMQEEEPDAPGARMSQMKRACQQSSIQLRVANGTAAASTVTIQKIEVIGEGGTVVAELTPRAPSRWADDSYQAWDEAVAAREVLQVSYALSAPILERGATYTVRVVVAAGDGERTLEQRTTIEAEASMPPDAVT